MMNAFEQLLGNRIFVCAVTGWFVAQLLKTIIHVLVTGKFEPERLTGSGGMLPFFHSVRYGYGCGAALWSGFL